MTTNLSNLNLSKGSIPPLLKYKIVFLGDQAVGKSSIINRFIYDIFDGNQHRPTIGIDFISQNIFLEDKTIRLQLWDTAGQQRFRALIPNYIRDASVAVIVYDITSKSSFDSMQKWIDDVKHQRGEGCIMAILGNKNDLQEERVIERQEAEGLAKNNDVIFKQVSAKSGQGIQQFFKQVASLLPDVGGGASTTTTTSGNVQPKKSDAYKQQQEQKQQSNNLSKQGIKLNAQDATKSRKQRAHDRKGCC